MAWRDLDLLMPFQCSCLHDAEAREAVTRGQRIRDDTQSQLLWMKGDRGKGKTMLISGILDEISPSTKLRDKQATTLLSYFFCQATDNRINNASAALRGLIYLLID